MKSARKLPPDRSLSRKGPRLSPKVKLYVVCEGENTEPGYFTACVDYYGASLVELALVPGAGVPMTLVGKAIEIRERLLVNARKSTDSFSRCFRVWAVFDRDEHPRVDEAIELAAVNGIDIAFSDPCFELWPILHLRDYGAQDGRHELQRLLSELMEGYDHEAGAVIDFELIKDDFDRAYNQAERLLRQREAENCPLGRPSTTVGRLVLKIIQNGKCWPTSK